MKDISSSFVKDKVSHLFVLEDIHASAGRVALDRALL